MKLKLLFFVLFATSMISLNAQITLGDNMDNTAPIITETPVEINTKPYAAYCRFKPSETAVYQIYSTGGYDTYAELFDENFVYLTNNDDYSDLNFFIAYELTANETYYLMIREFDFSAVTIGLNIDGGGVLPVELSSFNVNASGKLTEVRWSTETELNNYGFEILASVEGKSFRKVGFMKGAGTVNTPNEYVFRYESKSDRYFRLRQIDLDGKITLSKIVEIEFLPELFELDQNYPNPFNPSTTIRYNLAKEGHVKLSVYNMLGQEVKTLINEFQTKGRYEVKLDAGGLASGLYLYKLESADFIGVRKMTLLK